ncbi:hypothetical protein CXG81DRAFT_17854 [Caulochytrium protostelioides]|uniref:Uncharacterized protein n=1 Tax=Caulochytrium protostelioides TaxID=1555241 RepID=A0A4P9XAV9_9FUNG|nr:hypothetical protein CXG81DRAFT_17854 [Caulochytrium protostelioides]|eukprot:RKP02492.1 hypothetical protein CXG81DRAFT_17854 [Caulochytrium protostelioides]
MDSRPSRARPGRPMPAPLALAAVLHDPRPMTAPSVMASADGRRGSGSGGHDDRLRPPRPPPRTAVAVPGACQVPSRRLLAHMVRGMMDHGMRHADSALQGQRQGAYARALTEYQQALLLFRAGLQLAVWGGAAEQQQGLAWEATWQRALVGYPQLRPPEQPPAQRRRRDAPRWSDRPAPLPELMVLLAKLVEFYTACVTTLQEELPYAINAIYNLTPTAELPVSSLLMGAAGTAPPTDGTLARAAGGGIAGGGRRPRASWTMALQAGGATALDAFILAHVRAFVDPPGAPLIPGLDGMPPTPFPLDAAGAAMTASPHPSMASLAGLPLRPSSQPTSAADRAEPPSLPLPVAIAAAAVPAPTGAVRPRGSLAASPVALAAAAIHAATAAIPTPGHEPRERDKEKRSRLPKLHFLTGSDRRLRVTPNHGSRPDSTLTSPTASPAEPGSAGAHPPARSRVPSPAESPAATSHRSLPARASTVQRANPAAAAPDALRPPPWQPPPPGAAMASAAASPDAGPAARSVWLMGLLHGTLTTGAYLTPRLLVAPGIWLQPTSKLAHLECKGAVVAHVAGLLQRALETWAAICAATSHSAWSAAAHAAAVAAAAAAPKAPMPPPPPPPPPPPAAQPPPLVPQTVVLWEDLVAQIEPQLQRLTKKLKIPMPDAVLTRPGSVASSSQAASYHVSSVASLPSSGPRNSTTVASAAPYAPSDPPHSDLSAAPSLSLMGLANMSTSPMGLGGGAGGGSGASLGMLRRDGVLTATPDTLSLSKVSAMSLSLDPPTAASPRHAMAANASTAAAAPPPLPAKDVPPPGSAALAAVSHALAAMSTPRSQRSLPATVAVSATPPPTASMTAVPWEALSAATAAAAASATPHAIAVHGSYGSGPPSASAAGPAPALPLGLPAAAPPAAASAPSWRVLTGKLTHRLTGGSKEKPHDLAVSYVVALRRLTALAPTLQTALRRSPPPSRPPTSASAASASAPAAMAAAPLSPAVSSAGYGAGLPGHAQLEARLLVAQQQTMDMIDLLLQMALRDLRVLLSRHLKRSTLAMSK